MLESRHRGGELYFHSNQSLDEIQWLVHADKGSEYTTLSIALLNSLKPQSRKNVVVLGCYTGGSDHYEPLYRAFDTVMVRLSTATPPLLNNGATELAAAAGAASIAITIDANNHISPVSDAARKAYADDCKQFLSSDNDDIALGLPPTSIHYSAPDCKRCSALRAAGWRFDRPNLMLAPRSLTINSHRFYLAGDMPLEGRVLGLSGPSGKHGCPICICVTHHASVSVGQTSFFRYHIEFTFVHYNHSLTDYRNFEAAGSNSRQSIIIQ